MVQAQRSVRPQGCSSTSTWRLRAQASIAPEGVTATAGTLTAWQLLTGYTYTPLMVGAMIFVLQGGREQKLANSDYDCLYERAGMVLQV